MVWAVQDDILQERLESKDAELRAMREQVALLKENIKSNQALLATRTAEKEECEYQWATTKGQLAKSESDFMMLQVGTVCVSVCECVWVGVLVLLGLPFFFRRVVAGRVYYLIVTCFGVSVCCP